MWSCLVVLEWIPVLKLLSITQGADPDNMDGVMSWGTWVGVGVSERSLLSNTLLSSTPRSTHVPQEMTPSTLSGSAGQGTVGTFSAPELVWSKLCYCMLTGQQQQAIIRGGCKAMPTVGSCNICQPSETERACTPSRIQERVGHTAPAGSTRG